MENKEGTICRSVTFYNDYLPVPERGIGAEFCAFGMVDEIDLGDILSLDETRASITERIWEEQREFNSQLKGKYNAQRIYIVRDGSEKEEKGFWEGSERPFFFFCRIQCNGDRAQLMRDRKGLEKSGAEFCFDNGIKIRTYLTYDNTDIFIVIRASKYSKGVEVIARLHLGMNFIRKEDYKYGLKNSFTIMAVRYKWIKEMVISQKKIWNQDKIEKVYIRLIERPEGKISKIEEEIKNRLGIEKEKSIRSTILGADDAIIVLSNIGWGDFLTLYNREDGLFGNRFDKSSLYNKNAAGVTTQLCVSLNDKNDSFFEEISKGKKNEGEEKVNDGEILKKQISKLRGKLDKIKEEGDCINELYIILNALPKYSGEMFNDYVFFPLLKVLDTLLDLMIQQMGKWSKQLDKEPFYDFLTSFCFYTQNTMLTDRYTAQILGFNVKIYDIPVKLNALYNAFMYSVASVLNIQLKNELKDKELTYDFIVMPGMADMVNVIELYKGVSNKQRLIKAEIPEYSFYNVSSMLTILTHETAHYVGRELRNREERTKVIISSYAHIYIKYIEHYAQLSGCEESAWQESKGRLINMIYHFLVLECDETFLKKKYTDQELYKKSYIPTLEQKNSNKEKAERNRKNIDYFAELLQGIHDAMVTIITGDLKSVFTPVLRIEENYWEKIQKASKRFILISNEYTVVSSENVLDGLMTLYEESFADLMSILILQMGVKEYVLGIIECAEYQNMEAEVLLSTEAVLRVAVVLGCILETEQAIRNGTLEKKPLFEERVFTNWRQELKDVKADGTDDSWRWVAGEALRLWYESACGQVEKQYKDNVYCALIYDDVVLKNATRYLRFCINKFADNYKEEEFRAKVNKLKELFWQFSGESKHSGEEQIKEMVIFIEAYKKELLQQMAKGVNSNGDSEIQ